MKKWSLNLKFTFVLSIFGLTSMLVAGLGISRIMRMSDEFKETVEVLNKRVLLAKEMQVDLNEIRVQEKVFILEEQAKKHDVADLINKAEDEVRDDIRRYRKIADDAGKRSMDQLIAHLDEWRKVSDELRKISLAGDEKAATLTARGKSKEILANFSTALEERVKHNEAVMTEKEKQIRELLSQSVNLIVIVALLSFLVGGALAALVLRAVNRAIDEVISKLDESSRHLNSAATQVADTSSRFAGAATEQAESLQETAASVEELNSMVQKNSENAKMSYVVSTQSQESANKGKQAVQDMVKAIDGINTSNNNIMEQINHSNQQISEIVNVIAEIGNKTKVINDIVFQTKLLSFNASVEAARAGEHGKGFAVVAEEVGNLAQMSGNAAKEISDMLDSSISKVESIVEETKRNVESLITEGRQRVDEGSKVARACDEALEEIVGSVTNASRLVGEITNATEVQSQGIREVTKAISQLDQVTQENSATAEQSATASEQLKEQSDALRGAVTLLIGTILGENAPENQDTSSRSRHSSEAKKKKPMKKTESAPPAAKVISMASSRTMAQPPKLKKAVGGAEFNVPSEDDPGFKDI